MTDVVANHPTAPRAPASAGAAPHLGWALAGLSAGAGVIHFAMVPGHADGGLLEPLGFAVVGWFQLVVAAAVLADRASARWYQAAIAGNLAAIGLWVWSRTTGLPFGAHEGVAEDVSAIDAAAVLLEVGVVLLAVRLLLAPGRTAVGRLAPALVAVAALGLTTTVITSPDAASHGGTGHDDAAHGDAGHDDAAHETAAGDHHGSTAAAGDDHATLMEQIDADRCDRGFNTASYWAEAEYLGIDTYQGGAMAASDAGHGDPGAEAAAADAPEPDPTGGRGSVVLDELVAATSMASGGEVAAARLVTQLGEADEDDYAAWLWWLKSTGALGHDHGEAAPGDTGGHGGHVGPQPWVAMTDPAECERLEDELAQAREVALRYPTAADAMEAGWVRVTPYVAGIAAHYMRFGYVDGEFQIDEPEMILYDGNEPDAHVVGLSYYIIHEGDAEPTQGFTGANDHGHRHIGLCTGPGGVIGDSTTTEEECAARGGRKSDGSNGWMSHAWVVPGCESAWGVFSAASPTLDKALQEGSGKDDGGCAASAVRDRYDLDDVAAAQAGGN
jgi:hypothetical protein